MVSRLFVYSFQCTVSNIKNVKWQHGQKWYDNIKKATPLSLQRTMGSFILLADIVSAICHHIFSPSYIFSLGCDLFGGISAALHCYFCWWSRQKSGWTVCFLIPYSSQRLFTETPASYYFNSCSFSATERRVRFFFSIDIELDALALMPELDGLLWKYFGIGGGAMMLIRYKLVWTMNKYESIRDIFILAACC